MMAVSAASRPAPPIMGPASGDRGRRGGVGVEPDHPDPVVASSRLTNSGAESCRTAIRSL